MDSPARLATLAAVRDGMHLRSLQILDMVTMDEVLYDLFLRTFADDTRLYGQLDSFDDPEHVDFRNRGELEQWLDGRLTWNRAFRPLFYRDIWPVLYRPDQFRFLCDILGQSNYPHDQEQRGLFDPAKLSVVPKVRRGREAARRAAPAPAPQVEFASVARLAPTTVGDDDDSRIEDPYGPVRRFLFGLLRLPGEENEFKVEDRVSSREHNLPLMPLLCSENRSVLFLWSANEIKGLMKIRTRGSKIGPISRGAGFAHFSRQSGSAISSGGTPALLRRAIAVDPAKNVHVDDLKSIALLPEMSNSYCLPGRADFGVGGLGHQ